MSIVDNRFCIGSDSVKGSSERRETQVKAGHKGQKCLRGQPLFYDELKRPMRVSITPTAIAWWEALAKSEGCSISEAMERAARGSLSTVKVVEIST